MRKSVKRILVSLAAVGLVAFAFFVWVFMTMSRQWKSEYMTARVIHHTLEIVSESPENWPRSWRDLPTGDYSEYTQFDFELDPSVATESEVLSTIRPKSGVYTKYPHAESSMREIWKQINSYQVEKAIDGKDPSPNMLE